ncbi:hypothetical protein ACIBG4_21915 [Nonomuraea sp. NPDC050383]|uniref:hypothetical protein n=1 Tax=Nonomuraea sp. NPDC050383 TaxID=3364362 RepID=UPI0037B5E746
MDPRAVEWAAFPGPQWYRPETVAEAFATLIYISRGDHDPGHAVRSAVGNDHAGTLYPAAVIGTDVLLDIIARHPGRPRNVALGVLLDWWGCFQPEPGFESYVGQEGETVQVIPAIVRRVRLAVGMLQVIAEQDSGARGLIQELITLLDQGWTLTGVE